MYNPSSARRRRRKREIDVVECALLLAFFLVGLTALIGKLHQMFP